ncbi:hypothetical protein [Chitinophaga ginsengisoli]|uniref:Uncharacterized protein n=1 Tax=Chitinophaga ginsengisoli TaxID=363837 RepID=A0A2P8FUE7_9BACT|nr:hypothetical protein [Chitinophaga ginsengisoli]PSL25347.1 hypothetical protein CLV42_11328 [Chitinophaga ginsengisoli]
MENETQEAKKPLMKSLREAILPIKEGDGIVIRATKNAGFGLFMILFSCVSVAVLVAMCMAL